MDIFARLRHAAGRALSVGLALAVLAGPAAAQGDNEQYGVGGALGALLAGRLTPKPKPAALEARAQPAGDERRAAYAQLCTPGREKLSPATCASMKRDLDRAATDEVSTAYRQFCTPGAETLSKSTCAAMRADAGAGAAAQITTPSKLKGVNERLCTGSGPASPATCAAMRQDMERTAFPASQGWLGLSPGRADDGVGGAYVYSVWPGGPAAQADIRTGDRLITLNGRAVNDDPTVRTALEGLGAGRRIGVKVLRGTVIRNVPVVLGTAPVLTPKVNASRTEKRTGSIWSGRPYTVDPIRTGEVILGMLERDDAESVSGWSWKADCIEVLGSEARNLRAQVTANRKAMEIDIQYDNCGYGLPWSIGGYGGGEAAFDVDFVTAAGRKTFLHVQGPPSAKPYEIRLREQTPRETAAWHEVNRQVAIAERERQANETRAAENRSAMWSAALQGAIIGATGGELPAMREDGSAPNLLDTLNGANARLQQQNAEGQARLNATIAAAQAQGEREARARQEQEATRRRTQNSRQAPATSSSGAPAPSERAQAADKLANPADRSREVRPNYKATDGVAPKPVNCTTRSIAAGKVSAYLSTESAARAQVQDWSGRNCGVNDVTCTGPISCQAIDLTMPGQARAIRFQCSQPATRPYKTCAGPSRVSGQ